MNKELLKLRKEDVRIIDREFVIPVYESITDSSTTIRTNPFSLIYQTNKELVSELKIVYMLSTGTVIYTDNGLVDKFVLGSNTLRLAQNSSNLNTMFLDFTDDKVLAYDPNARFDKRGFVFRSPAYIQGNLDQPPETINALKYWSINYINAVIDDLDYRNLL